MKTRFIPLSILLCGLLSATLSAEDVTTIEGQVFSNTTLRRVGDQIMLKMTVPGGTGTMEMGLPLARIAKITFAEPPELGDASAAAAKANSIQVLNLTTRFVSSQADFRDLPGSWWLKMARLRLLALAAAGKESECVELARQIGSIKSPEAKSLSLAGMLFASLASSKAVQEGAKQLPRLGGDESSALAQFALGKALKNNSIESLKAFLTVKVFYPSAALLQPAALMGAADCLLALRDTKRAAQELSEVVTVWPDSIQAPTAKKKSDSIPKN